MSHYVAIRLDAPRDINGNPRRVYLVIDPLSGGSTEGQHIIDTIDEGYEGRSALTSRYPGAKYLFSVKVTTQEYKTWLKLRNDCGEDDND
jgi:hypothetical protein